MSNLWKILVTVLRFTKSSKHVQSLLKLYMCDSVVRCCHSYSQLQFNVYTFRIQIWLGFTLDRKYGYKNTTYGWYCMAGLFEGEENANFHISVAIHES